jgi:hypothetical protein
MNSTAKAVLGNVIAGIPILAAWSVDGEIPLACVWIFGVVNGMLISFLIAKHALKELAR